MLQDIENTPTYQRLVEKGREEGRAEIRQSVLDIVQLRFPSLSVLVKARIEQITDLTQLREVLLKVKRSEAILVKFVAATRAARKGRESFSHKTAFSCEQKEYNMAAERQPHHISVEEYFALEENMPGICYEYVDGYAYMMAGGSFDHDAIKSNIQRIIGNFLLEHDRCNVYSSDIKTQVAEKRYYHPDVVITCDPRDQGTGDLLKYPRVIFEVLSPSTERVDRTRKMRDYLALPTVEEYLLVDSQTYRVEMYRREGQKWVYYVFEYEDVLELASIDLRFPVAAAYAKVQLAPEEIEDEAD